MGYLQGFWCQVNIERRNTSPTKIAGMYNEAIRGLSTKPLVVSHEVPEMDWRQLSAPVKILIPPSAHSLRRKCGKLSAHISLEESTRFFFLSLKEFVSTNTK
ncbi:hypothetical protein Naga_100790g2 [Nannochloropsis gaditana]|uniref:Uncharacterized protein n=1 Tax=Nannochloropsis gaditana TaxID=72520 RepID=W7TDZ6_9STRA|nr:hypothetical protein Naga_100790g2 [Nannochloropsis gaditana]